MARVGRLIAMAFGAGCAALLVYSQIDSGATNTTSAAPIVSAEQTEPPAPEVTAPPTVAPLEPSVSPDTAPTPPVLTPAAVARLTQDVVDADAGKRAGAIDALAAAPEADAVPVLQRVLGSGGDVDRQLALSSLHTLALRDGDAGGAIRELLRQAIYDGGDEAVASGAQAALEDIERDTKAPDTDP